MNFPSLLRAKGIKENLLLSSTQPFWSDAVFSTKSFTLYGIDIWKNLGWSFWLTSISIKLGMTLDPYEGLSQDKASLTEKANKQTHMFILIAIINKHNAAKTGAGTASKPKA